MSVASLHFSLSLFGRSASLSRFKQQRCCRFSCRVATALYLLSRMGLFGGRGVGWPCLLCFFFFFFFAVPTIVDVVYV